MIELKMIDSGEELNHMHTDIELLYVLKGHLSVRISDKSYDLKQSDVIAVNANTQHGFGVPDQSIICRIYLKYEAFLENVQKNYALLWCNSTMARAAAYGELTGILDEMIDIWLVSGRSRYIRQSITYRLIGCLAEHFMMTDNMEGQTGDKNSRKDSMLRYINTNYFRTLSLNEMAEYTFMTQTAFSKYFKKVVGTNFVEYLNQVRLNYAVQDLLFSDKPMTQIAMDNGFSNPSVFNKHFRTVYHMTPTMFRDSMKQDMETPEQVEGDDHELARWYLQEKRKDTEALGEECRVYADVRHKERIGKVWTAAVNLGPARMLLSETYRKQILAARQRVAFGYGRIRHLFSEEMRCLKPGASGRMTCDLQDDVLDFLHNHAVLPVIRLDLCDSVQEESTAMAVLREWIDHVRERYGLSQVCRWIFEVPVRMEEDGSGRSAADAFSGRSAADSFETAARLIRDRIPGAVIGAACASPKQALIFAQDMPEAVGTSEVQPDFLSVDIIPASRMDAGEIVDSVISDHKSVLKDAVRSLKAACDRRNLPLWISRWNLSTSESNVYNDSNQKAALMLQNMTDAFEDVSMGIYACLSDLENSYDDSTVSWCGGSGLINKDGILKPALFAISFMDILLPDLVKKEDGCIITAGEEDRYVILCFNAKAVSQEYYLKAEEDMTPDDLDGFSIDTRPRTFHISLQNVPRGRYRIKKMLVSPEEGSILKVWEQLGRIAPDRAEKDYMRHRCEPSMTIFHGQTQGNTLILDETLAAHEFCLYYLFPDEAKMNG